MNHVERIEPQAVDRFDYSTMTDDVAARHQERVAKITGIYRRTAEGAAEIGRELIAAQDELEHGLFLKWTEDALGISKSTAYRFMDVARSPGDKLPTVGTLPLSTVYRLAAKSLPEPVRTEIVNRLDAGEMTVKQVEDRVWEAAQRAKQEAADARLSKEERKRREQRKRTAEARHRRDHEKHQREWKETEERQAEAVRQIADLLSARLSADEIETVRQLLIEHHPYTLAIARALPASA